MTNKTFRLFISSTFNDFKEERRLLQKYVFPKVQEYCQSLNKGYVFLPIDLRWGVNEEAQFDQSTLELCLEEVKRSKAEPHPNFLIMAGNRYGWIPLPNIIEQSELEEILVISNTEEKTILEEWYELDKNQIPSSFILKPREEKKHKEPKIWEDIENKIRQILQDKATQLKFDENKAYKYFTSATEQEVDEGIFKYLTPTKSQLELMKTNPDYELEDYENVFGYIRNINHIENRYKGYFFDENQNRLYDFKNEIRKSIKNIFEVNTTIDKCKINDNHSLANYSYKEIDNEENSQFVQQMYKYMISSITSYDSKTTDMNDDEDFINSEQKRFKEEKLKNFIGREDAVNSILDYTNGNSSNQAYILYGKSGLGKSAVMAKAIHTLESSNLYSQLIYKFVGSTPKLNSSVEILISILKDLEITEEVRQLGENQTEPIEEFYYRVESHLKELEQKVIIFIDAIDQVSNEDQFLWLSKYLPQNITIVISVLNDENYEDDTTYFKALKDKTSNIHELKPFAHGEHLLQNILKKYNRQISKIDQLEYFESKYNQVKTPLYVVITAEEMRFWSSEKKDYKLSDTQQKAVQTYIENLHNIYHHNKEFIDRVFSFINISGGLSEFEFLEILNSDEQFVKKLAPDLYNKNETNQIPIVIWLRLYYQIKQFLKSNKIDRHNFKKVLTFFYREFMIYDSKSDSISNYYYSLLSLVEQMQSFSFFDNRYGSLLIEVLPQYIIKYQTNETFIEVLTNNFLAIINNDKYMENFLILLNATTNKQLRSNLYGNSFVLQHFNLLVCLNLYELDKNKWIKLYSTAIINYSSSAFKIGSEIDMSINLLEDLINKINSNDANDNKLKIIQSNVFNNLAMYYYQSIIKLPRDNHKALKKTTKALEYLDQSIVLYKSVLKEDMDILLAEKLINFAYIYERISKTKSLMFYNQFTEQIRPYFKKNPEIWKRQYITLLNNLGLLTFDYSLDYVSAINYLEEAFELKKKFYDERTDFYQEGEYNLKKLYNFAKTKNNQFNFKFFETSKTKNISANKKIGRNDSCPCNSGKKYKKCCGKNS